MRVRLIAAAAVLTMIAGTGTAAAQGAGPRRDLTIDPADRAVVEEVATIDPETATAARLDALLAKLPRPTPLRGMVQTLRAYTLSKANDEPAAIVAIEEAMRLLPDDPRPKLLATAIFAFSGAETRAADLWLQVSRAAPQAARTLDGYILGALVGRLRDRGDHARADRVRARMVEIGFSNDTATERSAAALAQVNEAVRAGEMTRAATGVTAIADPADLAMLYLDKRSEALWPRIAEWAGADLGLARKRNLEELRSDWTAAQGFETAVPYARALAEARAYGAVVGLFLPLLDRPLSATEDTDWMFLVPLVARSLDRLGRQSEALALLDKAAAAAAPDTDGNRLNIDGSYITLAAHRLDWPQVLARTDAFLAAAASLGPAINPSATIAVRGWRACALSRLGRMDEGRADAALVLSAATQMPGPAMDLHLCRGDGDAAKALLVARLSQEARRGWALEFVQPAAEAPDTALDREQRGLSDRVRTAPEVVAAANAVGRILPKPLASGLPDGFDPFRVQPGSAAGRIAPGTT